jgi:YbbR domain-containing protein
MFSNSIAIEPAFVTVYGDNATLDTLSAVKTVRLDKKNIDKKMNFSSQLSIPAGTRLSVDMVKLTTDVEEYTEKSFTLPILCYNLPENRTVRFFPSTVELYVQVGLSKYPLLSEADFEIGADYNNLIKQTSMNYPLALTKNPQWLVNYRIVPEVVEFLVEQKRNP